MAAITPNALGSGSIPWTPHPGLLKPAQVLLNERQLAQDNANRLMRETLGLGEDVARQEAGLPGWMPVGNQWLVLAAAVAGGFLLSRMLK